jgi:cytosine/adenosine deaminase-related metal-dependent hydrolase
VRTQRTLISGGTIVSMNPQIGVLERGDILVADGRIAEIAPHIECEDAERVDAMGKIVAPGFVDTHRHVWQTQLRGVAGDWSLFDYSCLMRNAYSASYDPEDAFLGNYVGALEALNAGVTTIVDHSHLQISRAHSDGLVQGLKQAGIRGIYCHGLYANPPLVPGAVFDPKLLFATPEQVEHQRKLGESVRKEHFSGSDGLLTFGLAATEWVATNIEQVVEEVEWARRLEPARFSIHIGMGLAEELRVIPALAERDLLGDDLLFVHGAHLTDEDLSLLAQYGGWVSSTPETELQMGMGYPVLERVAETGKEPSLGIDIVSNFGGDMFAQMRLMLQTWRFSDYEREGVLPISKRYPAARMLHTATQGGATAAGLGERVGSLEPGKQADIILVRSDGIHMAPMNDAIAALVFYATAHDVDTVWVAGRAVKREGELVGINWPKLRGELEESRDRILSRYRKMPVDEIRETMAPFWEALRRSPGDVPE